MIGSKNPVNNFSNLLLNHFSFQLRRHKILVNLQPNKCCTMGEEKDWFFEEEELNGAVDKFEEMMNVNAHYFFDVHELEGIINYYIDRNNFPKAASAAEYGYKLYPESTIIQLKIAQLLLDKGKLHESMSILNQLEQIESSNYEVFILKGTAYNMLGKITEAEHQFDKAVALSEDNKNEVLYNIGLSFEERQEYATAIRYFLMAYESDSQNIILLYDLAYCYERNDNLNESVKYYELYLDEDPFSDNAWFNLGTVFSRIEQPDKAIEAFDFAIAINENFGSAYYNKGNILSNQEKYREALDCYLEFIKLEENNVLALCYIGECYEKLKMYDEAECHFQKAVTLDPKSPEAWYGRGVVKMQLGLLDESLLNIKTAIDLSEDNTEYLYALGLVMFRKNDFASSLKIFKEVIDLDPTDCEAWLYYSEVFFNTGNLNKAIEALNVAYDLNFENPYINIRLASYHLLSGNHKKGYFYIEKAINFEPSCIDDLYDFYPEAMGDEKIQLLIDQITK
jgi:tetratricopeptide (TPR) repeat protein